MPLGAGGYHNRGRGRQVSQNARQDRCRRLLLAAAASLCVLPAHSGLAQQGKDPSPAQQTKSPSAAQQVSPAPQVKAPSPAPPDKKPAPGSAAAAHEMADFFSKVGDQIYEDCIFELSDEQVEVQTALIQAYVKQGASSAMARKLAVKQIEPPKLSAKCAQIKDLPRTTAAAPPPPPPAAWTTTTTPSVAKKPAPEAIPKVAAEPPVPAITLANKKTLPQWDCAPEVDYVTIHLKGYERKLTGGEICNPFEDVVHELPDSAQGFRLGYTIKTGRLFVVADDPQLSGKTIAWGISGRDVCRNNPDPDCIAAKAVGPLPPGLYTFAGDKDKRINWGPNAKRNVAGVWLTKLWNKEKFTPSQIAGIRSRGNIAIHVRLKGEMSEACIGMEPKGWAYVASLIKDGRATGLNVYIDEPYPQIAEAPPVVVASSFSLTSLFK